MTTNEMEQMRADYDSHCKKKVQIGAMDYYVHDVPNCGCQKCTRSMTELKLRHPDPNDLALIKVYPIVTFHRWVDNKHGYQEFGRQYDEIQAAIRAAYFAGTCPPEI